MADKFKKYFDPLKSKVKSSYSNSPLGLGFDLIEAKTSVDSAIIAIALCSILAIYLVFGWCNDFLCNFIGLIYGAYVSSMAILLSDTSNQKQLLMYWIIYSTLDLGSNERAVNIGQHLADALRYNTTLTTLELGWNKIGDTGTEYLADALYENMVI
ncbi:unnamed protein product [Rotaria sordida]|uniref:Uncharacterized protein n=1 Tax=Rotaria sordida TaxID=392033 RepID=A0A814HU11_9BILA|nr:unnamed protein product [Rotaria sordida]